MLISQRGRPLMLDLLSAAIAFTLFMSLGFIYALLLIREPRPSG